VRRLRKDLRLSILVLATACLGGEMSSPKASEEAAPSIELVRCRGGDCLPIIIDWNPGIFGTGGSDPCEWGELRMNDSVPSEKGSSRGTQRRAGLRLSGQGAAECLPNVFVECQPFLLNFLQNTTCTLQSIPFAPEYPIVVQRWRFVGDYPDAIVTRPTSDWHWAGPVVLGGTVEVDFTMAGITNTVRAQIYVFRRDWTWATGIGGRDGLPGEVDDCFQPSANPPAGITVGMSCTDQFFTQLFTPAPQAAISDGSGYSAQSVPGSGPNSGIWYMQGVSATMQLRTQIHKEYRADGPTHPLVGDPVLVNHCTTAFNNANPRNMHAANTLCFYYAEFDSAVAVIWDHERRHMTTGLQYANASSGDLYKRWEPLVALSNLELQSKVRQEYQNTAILVANGMLTAHGTQTATFHFYRFISDSAKWLWGPSTYSR